MRTRTHIPIVLLPGLLLGLAACAERPGSVPEVPTEETAAQVAELEALHSVMEPMWHEAFPAKDIAAIQAAVAQFEPLLAALDTARLPGILQDKQARWDEQKQLLKGTFDGFKAASAAGAPDQILAFAEAFHMNYEGMVRIIRPVVPELETFHQHLYGLYHYYGPGYDLEKIRRAADAMAEAVPPLRAAQLPARVAELQGTFEGLVDTLGVKVSELQTALQDPSKAGVQAAIEAVHSAYQAVEGIFG
jgi:hypothetical protein